MEYGYLDKEVKALVNERDRLAAENAELKDLLAIEQIPHADANEQLAAANATLDRLRAAVPEGSDKQPSYQLHTLFTQAVCAILYPENEA